MIGMSDYRRMMDIMSGRFAKYTGGVHTWLFFLALFSPAGLFLSYAFVMERLLPWYEMIFIFHGVALLVSVVFCAVWTASHDLRERVRVAPLLMGLFMYPVFQLGLHLGAMLLGWIPIMWMMGKFD